jgi:hypothetical protein
MQGDNWRARDEVAGGRTDKPIEIYPRIRLRQTLNYGHSCYESHTD